MSILASKTIDATGGTLSVTDTSSPLAGTTVVIPAGALVSPTTITISQVTGGSGLPAGVLVVNLGPTGTVFSVPVTVTVTYLQQYLTDNNISDPTTLKIVLMNDGVANETLLTVSQSTVNRTITAQSTHFSNFAALGYSNASLSGPYTVVTYGHVPGTQSSLVNLSVPGTPFSTTLSVPIPATGFESEIDTITFNGAGGFTSSDTVNKDGVVTTKSSSGTYSVAPDGTLTIAGSTGSVLAGGSTFIVAPTSDVPGITIGILK